MDSAQLKILLISKKIICADTVRIAHSLKENYVRKSFSHVQAHMTALLKSHTHTTKLRRLNKICSPNSKVPNCPIGNYR
jgi:hypothetical protein